MTLLLLEQRVTNAPVRVSRSLTVGLTSANTLQRLADRILEAHPTCGRAAALLTVDGAAPDAADRIEAIIRPTPEAFAERMRRVAASGFGQRFRDVQDGARQLGVRPVLATAVAATTMAALDGATTHVDRLLLWRHVTAVGLVALTAALFDHAHEDRAFAAGFFPGIGRLLLDRFAPESFGAAAAAAAATPRSLSDAIDETFGFSEAELMATLALRWGMPEWLVESLAYPIREQDLSARAHTLAGTVARAQLVARSRGFGSEREPLDLPPEHLRWLTDPLLTALDRAGGNSGLEMRIDGVIAIGLPDDPERHRWH